MIIRNFQLFLTTTLLTILVVVTHLLLLGGSGSTSKNFVAADQVGSALELMLKKVKSTDPTSVIAEIAQTWTTDTGIRSALSKVLGKGGSTQTIPANYNSCLRMGRLSEVIIAYAAVALRAETSFATSLDVQVPSSLMPSGVNLVHPTQGTAITFKMLLMHTSTITDVNFETATRTTPNTVGTLASFVQSYFVDGVGALNAAVFGSNTVGTAAAYNPARANYALLAYVLEQIAINNGYSSLKQYIALKVLTPFGMSSTFWLETDGSTPGVSPTPVFSGTFTSMSTTSTTVYTNYFDGCIIDRTNAGSWSIHPAWAADYMGYSTVGDISRLAFQLFINTADNSVFSSLMQEKLTLDSSVTSMMRQGQSGQGLGLNYFNGDSICGAAQQTFVISSCPVSNLSKIVGFASSSQSSSLAFFCTPRTIVTSSASSSTSTLSQSCVTVGIAAQSTRSSFDAMFAIAGAAFQEDFGETTLNTITTPSPSGTYRTTAEENEYGVSVLFGSFLTFVGAVILTILTQYFLMPEPVAAVTDTVGVGPSARAATTSN